MLDLWAIYGRNKILLLSIGNHIGYLWSICGRSMVDIQSIYGRYMVGIWSTHVRYRVRQVCSKKIFLTTAKQRPRKLKRWIRPISPALSLGALGEISVDFRCSLNIQLRVFLTSVGECVDRSGWIWLFKTPLGKRTNIKFFFVPPTKVSTRVLKPQGSFFSCPKPIFLHKYFFIL